MKTIYLCANDAEVQQLLKQRPVRMLTMYAWNSFDRESFLKEYIDLIGRLGEANHSVHWWATDISSKNRFYSPVTFALQKFLLIMKSIEMDSSPEDCVVNDVPYELVAGLEEALHAKGIAVKWVGSRSTYYKCWFFGKLRRWGGVVYNLFKITLRWMWIRYQLTQYVNTITQSKESYYVIRSFIAKRSFDKNNHYQDVFFGGLPQFVAKQRKVIIFGDIFGEFKETVECIKRSDIAIIPFEFYVSFLDIVKACISAVTYAIPIPAQTSFYGYQVAALLKEVCWLNDSKIQTHQFLHYVATQRFLERVKVDTFVLSYENNPWEKMCMLALRKDSPATWIIGYQHNVVPQASANMFMSQYEYSMMPRPNRVLTVGQTPKDIIHHYETCLQSDIQVSCALRLNKPSVLERQQRGHILLALEGLPEVSALVNYVLNEVGNNMQYKLMIRTHPILPVDQFKHLITHDLDKVSNLTISTQRTLKEDLEWADIVMYWGSTVGLEAMSMGKPVINYDIGNILNYDPLFNCTSFKWQTDAQQPLVPILEQIFKLDAGQYQEGQQLAQQYIERYFYVSSPARMEAFLIK